MGHGPLAHGGHRGGHRGGFPNHRVWFNRPAGYWAGYGGYRWPWAGPTLSVYNADCTTHFIRGRVAAIVMYSRYPDVYTLRLNLPDDTTKTINELFWYNGNLEHIHPGDFVQFNFEDCGNSTQRWISNVIRL